MRNALKVALGLALVMGAGACSDYLSGPGIDTDPNNVDKLTRPGALYFGIQAAQVVQREGQLARNAVQYVQQVSGNSRQSIGFDRYTGIPYGEHPAAPMVKYAQENTKAGHSRGLESDTSEIDAFAVGIRATLRLPDSNATGLGVGAESTTDSGPCLPDGDRARIRGR